MTRFAPIVALAMTLATLPGYSGDSSTSVLAAGSGAVVSAEKGSFLDGNTKPTRTYDLDPGVRLTVGFDPGFHIDQTGDKHAPPTKNSGFRKVKVTVESGRYQGVSGEVYRNDITPAP